MEFRNCSDPTPKLTTTVAAFLMMYILLNAAVSSSAATLTEEPMKTAAVTEAEYDVDYRGPETHPAVFPPPGHFKGRTFLNRR
ncbi:hypothetical protein LINPERPRIM_LOCUS15529 [Linum perenne]